MSLFVVRISGLAEEASVWQAFSVDFFAIFLTAFAADVAHTRELLERYAARRHYITRSQFGGLNPNSLCNFAHSQSTKLSFLMAAAFPAAKAFALSRSPFKQYK